MKEPWTKPLLETACIGDAAHSEALPALKEPAMKEPFISIVAPNRDGMGTQVKFNGIPFKHLTGISVSLGMNMVNQVHIDMAFIRMDQIDLGGARLTIDGDEIPEPVQRALYSYLADKFKDPAP